MLFAQCPTNVATNFLIIMTQDVSPYYIDYKTMNYTNTWDPPTCHKFSTIPIHNHINQKTSQGKPITQQSLAQHFPLILKQLLQTFAKRSDKVANFTST